MSTRTYYVETRTGDYEYAGTNADVRIQLIGANNRVTSEMRLDNPGRNDRVQGAVDQFTVSGEDVGWVNKFRVFHDNSGQHPGWYLDYVKVTYADLGLELQADFYRWLARTVGDHLVDVTKNVNVDISEILEGFMEAAYLAFDTKQFANNSASADTYKYIFRYQFTEGVSLTLGSSRAVKTSGSLSAGFFGIGSSFETEVTKSTSSQLNSSAQVSLTSEIEWSTELAPGQAKTAIMLYFQPVSTAEALANGIRVPYEQRFPLTFKILTFDGLLSDAEVRQRVIELLAQILGKSVSDHDPLQRMDLRFNRKKVPDPVNAGSVARALREQPREIVQQAHLARYRGAALTAESNRVIRRP